MSVDRFTTNRLVARHWRADVKDSGRRRALESALSNVLTAAVLEHLPEPLQLSGTGDAIADWVSARADESDVLLVSSADSMELVGLLILASDPHPHAQHTIHLGYLFAEAAWGRGYATELVSGLVAALDGKGPIRLIGGVGRGNAASARVLEKAGFRHNTELSTEDTDMFVRVVGSPA